MIQLMRLAEPVIRKLREKKAETLLETVMSIALFAMMALMVASMFGMANRVSLRNVQTDEEFDAKVSALVEETPGEVTVSEPRQIIFTSDSGTYSVSVKRITTSDGSLCKLEAAD